MSAAALFCVLWPGNWRFWGKGLFDFVFIAGPGCDRAILSGVGEATEK